MAERIKSYHEIEVVAACIVSLCKRSQDCEMSLEEWADRFHDNCEEMFRLLQSAAYRDKLGEEKP